MNLGFHRMIQQEKILLLLFVLSFLNAPLILMLFAYMLILSAKSVEYGIKSLILIAFRTIMSTHIAVDISSVQMFKWVMIFLISTLILLESKSYWTPSKVKNGTAIVTMFCAFICVVSILNSTYPLVSIFKCISYGYVFVSIICGVSATTAFVDWADCLYQYFTFLLLGCIISAPFSFAYYSSAHWFCGITNQSQMYGIMAALYCALLLNQMMRGNRSIYKYAILIGVTYLTFLSGSRTGMIASLICILYGLYVEIFQNKRTYLLLILFFAIGVVVVFYRYEVSNIFTSFILKDKLGTQTNISVDAITLSRQGQYENFLQKFNANPLFGTGFMVPFVEGIQDWSFSFGLIVENGNLVYSVLGDLGIVGFVFFVLTYGHVFLNGKKGNGGVILFFAPFLISFGEMVFFSTNNNAILLYVMIATYYAEGCGTSEGMLSDQYTIPV